MLTGNIWKHINHFPLFQDETGTEAMFISLKIADEYRCEEVKAMVEECKLLITKFRAVMEEDTVLRDLIIVYFLFRPNEKLSNMEYIKYVTV